MKEIQVRASTGLEIQVKNALHELAKLDTGHILPNLLVVFTPWGNKETLWAFAGNRYGHYDYEMRAAQTGHFHRCPFALKRLLDEVRLAISRIKKLDGGKVVRPLRVYDIATL